MTTTRVMLVAVAAASLIAVASLLSWPLDLPVLRGMADRRYSMVPNTAVAVLLACVALLVNRKRLAMSSRVVALLAALGTTAMGGAELGGYLYGWDTSAIDLLQHARALSAGGQTGAPPRMAVNTAFCLTAIGVAIILLLIARRPERPLRPWLRGPITILAGVVFAAAFLALIGHLYSVTGLYSIRGLSAMSPNTAMALSALAIAVLFARPNEGLGQLITGSDAGAIMARRLLPVALLAPVLIGAARVAVEGSGIITPSAATILRSLVEVLLFLLVVLVTARKIRTVDEERARVLEAERSARAQAETERTRIERLQEFTASLGIAKTPLEVARATLETGCRAVGLESGVVFVLEDGDKPGDTLALVHAVGYDDATVRRWQRMPNNPDTLAGDAIARRAAIVIGRRAVIAERYPAMLPLLETTSYSGGAAFPLMPFGSASRGRPSIPGRSPSERTVLGCVAFDFDHERDLPDVDVRYLNAIAGLCAQAMERTRLFQAEHRARKAAQAEREQLAHLIDALPVIVTVYDPAFANTPGGGLTLNRAFVDTLGWTEDDARGGDLMALCYPDSDVRARAIEHLSYSSSSWLDIPTRAKNGRLVPLRWGSVRLGNRQVGVAIDQTAERERTAERAFLFEAERRSRAQAEAARAAAEEANQSKSQFLAKMSHELRTPLNAIGGHVQLVEMGLHGPVTDAQREALERAQKAQHHLLSLINDVLNYAKLEAGRVEFDLRPTSVDDAVHEVASIMAPQVQAKGLVLDVLLPEKTDRGAPTLVLADRDKLVQTLFNLLSNAIKFTPSEQQNGAPGRIAVELTCPEGTVDVAYLSVRDTGIGIPEQRQAAIFDPFVQVHTGLTREHSGTGLGLAISRDLARGMGGDLWCQSMEGQGSTFTLMLKRVAAQPAVPAPSDLQLADTTRRTPNLPTHSSAELSLPSA